MIDPAHYNGQTHRVPFTKGADFVAKWDAYRADGFEVCLAGEDHFLARKVMR